MPYLNQAFSIDSHIIRRHGQVHSSLDLVQGKCRDSLALIDTRALHLILNLCAVLHGLTSLHREAVLERLAELLSLCHDIADDPLMLANALDVWLLL